MTHREVLRAMSGLLLAMFVAILSSTVVSTSLPVIIAELHGTQTSYTWVVTATMLTTAVSTPMWGKLADLVRRKSLMDIAIIIFVVASALAGISQGVGTLIAARALQGIGAGGVMALSQVILADIVSPRERGKYNGLFGAVLSLAMVGGPLLGGIITDNLGWRWNFYVALPIAVVALVVLQRTLHLPAHPTRTVKIDYLGAALIAGSISSLLAWLSLAAAGQFDWLSWQTALMVPLGTLALIAAVIVELRAPEPIIPLTMFGNRTFTLSVIASGAVGGLMFGTIVFLAQYMQLARGKTPTVSGLLTIPMVVGLFLASVGSGRVISYTGIWKPFMVVGAISATTGASLLSLIDETTQMWEVGVAMFVLGAGLGMLMQNLVLVVQNSVDVRQLGVATSGVAFFRTVGGTVNVSVLGSLMAIWVQNSISDSIAALPPQVQAQAGAASGSGDIPKISDLPPMLAKIVEHAFGTAIGSVFLCTVPLGLIVLLAVSFLPHAELGTKNAISQRSQLDEGSELEAELAHLGEGLEPGGIEEVR